VRPQRAAQNSLPSNSTRSDHAKPCTQVDDGELLTNQNRTTPSQEYDIVYRHNVIWNCEYSFEYRNSPEESLTHHVYFEHTTCFGAGHGWGHTQRPDGGAGRRLCFYTNRARTRDFYVRHNIFCQAANVACDALWWPAETWADKAVIQLDHNCWFQPERTMIRLKGNSYAQADVPEARDGGWVFRTLYVDGSRYALARSPNRGYYRMSG